MLHFIARDYAHESGGFPTWHRLYLLWFEREMQILTGHEDFSVPYWDWTEKHDREKLFADDYFGTIEDEGKIGGFFGNENEWKTVCWFGRALADLATVQNVCDPRNSTGALHRCPNITLCDKNENTWPDKGEVKNALSMTEYDTSPFARQSLQSFRNYLEGFDIIDQCNAEVLCDNITIMEMNADGTLTTTTKGNRRRLHNSVS